MHSKKLLPVPFQKQVAFAMLLVAVHFSNVSHGLTAVPVRADLVKTRLRNAAHPDKREYLLKHDLEADEWFLGQQ